MNDNACRYGGGGDFVTVGIYHKGTLIGRVISAHLDREPSLYLGKSLPRWGAYLGVAANLTGTATGGPNCWTGRHVHTELRSEVNWSCWNKDYTLAYPVHRTNFIGFVGGNFGTNPRPCP